MEYDPAFDAISKGVPLTPDVLRRSIQRRRTLIAELEQQISVLEDALRRQAVREERDPVLPPGEVR